MRKVFGLLAAVFFAAAGLSPVQAEIKLPPQVMEYATEGINGVYTLDFDTANENIQKVFAL